MLIYFSEPYGSSESVDGASDRARLYLLMPVFFLGLIIISLIG
jgi:hypothetical protein